MGSLAVPYFCVRMVDFLREELHEGLQLGVTLGKVRGYTFGVIGGGNRGVEKYRFFKINPQFWHFTIKKKPLPCKFAPY